MNNENDTPSVGDEPKTKDEITEMLEANLKQLKEVFAPIIERQRRREGLPPVTDRLLGND